MTERDAARGRLRRSTSDELSEADVRELRALFDVAFGPDEDDRFTDDDWQHALGGVHVLLEIDGEIVAHAAVVEREIHIGDRRLRTGYVEAVATAPRVQGTGHGTSVMDEVDRVIRERFELGALGTGTHHFYERLGWSRWPGPTYVRSAGGLRATPHEDGSIMVLSTPSTPPLDLTAPISADERSGDAW